MFTWSIHFFEFVTKTFPLSDSLKLTDRRTNRQICRQTENMLVNLKETRQILVQWIVHDIYRSIDSVQNGTIQPGIFPSTSRPKCTISSHSWELCGIHYLHIPLNFKMSHIFNFPPISHRWIRMYGLYHAYDFNFW